MKVVMIIAHNGFRDEELFKPKEVFEQNGFKVVIASSNTTVSTGKLGAEVVPDILIHDINVSEYDAIVFVGGPGSKEYFNDPIAHKIANDAFSTGKILAAICIAPNILANAELLKDKKATCWDSDNLIAKGAIFTGASVERSGNIVTANGPHAAVEFANTVISAIGEK